MKQCVIAIPVYKKNANEWEKASLKRCREILGAHQIIAFAPDRLCLSEYEGFDFIERFSDSYFKDLGSYSNLMLSSKFYRRFDKYEYMLIYQPDCWVFNDQLYFWCGKGYDYIGAPFFNTGNYHSWKYNLIPGLRKFTAKVGNGGLTLRKVESHIRGAERFGAAGKLLRINEDCYWCSVVARLDHSFKIPGEQEAVKFAFDRCPAKAYEMSGGVLPFGCHAWPTNMDFYSRFIKLDSALVA